MELKFTRSDEQRYTTVAVRDDSVTLHIPSFDSPRWLPHDLGHFVVEQALGLRFGFWGCVAAGVIFPGMRVVGGRLPPHAAERSRTLLREVEASQCGTEAEVLVGFFAQLAQQRVDADEAATQAQLRALWQPSKSKRVPLNVSTVRSLCAELRAMRERWQLLTIGDGITVMWPQASQHKR